jgi:hypothetical protein
MSASHRRSLAGDRLTSQWSDCFAAIRRCFRLQKGLLRPRSSANNTGLVQAYLYHENGK